MADRIADWMALVADIYPLRDAEAWDSVGLQVGDPDDSVTQILVCLDVTEATLSEAAHRGAQLVLAHHPLLFRPLDRLTPSTAAGRLALRASRLGLNVAAVHTNFDAAIEGTTDPVVTLLGVRDVRPLSPVGGEEPSQVKLVVFVPVDATATVLNAAFAAGAGRIGEYAECSFRVTGTGTFLPSAAADPAVGERGRRNEVDEDRVEIVVGRSRMVAVVEAVRQAHPYEEVALDLYPVVPAPAAAGAAKGIGRIGTLEQPRRVGAIAATLRAALPSPLLRVAGDPERLVRTVAACGGASDSLIPAALAAGADLYITGDLRHHVTLDAMTMGLSLIDVGHHASEAPALPALIRALETAAAASGLQARLLASATSTDPWSTSPLQEE